MICLLLLLCQLCSAFYLPGMMPNSYSEGDEVALMVNHVTPSLRYQESQTKTRMFSYDYYDKKFHFCRPEQLEKQPESLGSIIFGDRIFNSPFELSLLKNTTCQSGCQATYSKKDASFFASNIRAGYQYNWLIDGLPVANKLEDHTTKTEYYSSGFKLGYVDDDNTVHPYNHFDLFVEYHKRSDGSYRVVGSTVETSSREYTDTGNPDCGAAGLAPIVFNQGGETEITYTYAVHWVPSETAWATRWDKYLHVYDPKIQWFSLLNFSVIVVILSVVLTEILFKNIKTDIQRYNEFNLDDDAIDESGWRLVSGDVFRPPQSPMLLSVLLGSGAQLLLMSFVTCGFALLGLLSPSNRGSLSTVMFILYAVFGFFGSFVSGYIYKMFNGADWRTNMILTPLLVPGAFFAVFLLLNALLVFAGSSGAVPFGTMLAILAIWFLVSIPLSALGTLVAVKRAPVTLPCKVNQIPRQIPKQPWYMQTPFLALVAGLFPFGAISVEMYFIYNSIWFNRIYYMFGFLFFCFSLMLMTTMLVTLLFIYLSLCRENYKWQWEALFIGGGISIYVFVHSIFLSGFRLGGFISIALYVGYSFLLATAVGLICGTVGFLAASYFVITVYSQIKVD